MRVSSDKSDAGYDLFCQVKSAGGKIQVFLNGERQEYCDTADDTIGFVRRLKKSSIDGKPYALGNEFAIEELTGNVRIELGIPQETNGSPE